MLSNWPLGINMIWSQCYCYSNYHLTLSLFLDLKNLHRMALIQTSHATDLPEPRLWWPPRATEMHIMDPIPSFTHKGRPVPPPLALKQFHLLVEKQGQRGAGQCCSLGRGGLRSWFMCKGCMSCTGKGDAPLDRHSTVLAHRHSAFSQQHLGHLSGNRNRQTQKSKRIFFFKF